MPPPSSVSMPQPASNLQNRKRPGPNDIIPDRPAAKRIKKTSAVRIARNFPPEFWDNLSKVWLTPRALREIDRRSRAKPPATTSRAEFGVPTTLARFSRHGGPYLGHLRGYTEPKHAARMSSNLSSASSSRRTESTKATNLSSRVRRSSAYDNDFEQNLIDHGIYTEGYIHTDQGSTPEPENLDDIIKGLSNPRASLSPSQFSTSAFKSFKLANSNAISEGRVMADILPTICGSAAIPKEGNLPFVNLASITDGVTVNPTPDLYDGSRTDEISKTVREDLSKMIIPTRHARAPVAPNFFIEAKGPRGGTDVARRQACLDGAVGARAMHSLQSYGEAKPVYDGNARSFSSTYHSGQLMLYAHHMTGPAAEGEQPEYHMTHLDGYTLNGNKQGFIAGVTAFRNLRDLARGQREMLIQAANARASRAQDAPVEHISEACAGNHSHGHVFHSESPVWHDSHDDLQQHIAQTHAEACEDDGPTTLTPQYISDESPDPGQDPSASGSDDPLLSVESSFSSGFSADTVRPKRARESFSSPTQGSRSSKSRRD